MENETQVEPTEVNATGETADETTKLDAIEASETQFVDFVLTRMDKVSALDDRIAVSKDFARHVKKKRSLLAEGAYTEEKYKNDVERCTNLIQMRSPIDVRLNEWTRLAAFVRVVEPIAPSVKSVSCFVIAGKLLPGIEHDPLAGTASVRTEWVEFLKEIIEIQTRVERKDRLTMDQLDARLAQLKADIKSAKKSKPVDPDKELTRLQEAENRRLIKARTDAIASVGSSMTDALNNSETKMTPADLLDCVETVAKSFNLPVPVKEVVKEVVKTVGCNPATATITELKQFLQVMIANDRFKELGAIHTIIGRVLASQEVASAA